MRGAVALNPFFSRHRLVRDDIMDIGLLRPPDEHPRCLPRATRAASLSCILMLSVVELCDTAAMAAAVFSSSLSRKTNETAPGEGGPRKVGKGRESLLRAVFNHR
jgi:hypothetical protein